jgi:hypothetical protein
MEEPAFLEPFREYDRRRYARGEPWGKFPWSLRFRLLRDLLKAAFRGKRR